MIKKIAERSLLIVETLLVSTHMKELSIELMVLAGVLVATLVVTATIAEHTRKSFVAVSSDQEPRTTTPEESPSRPRWDRSRFF